MISKIENECQYISQKSSTFHNATLRRKIFIKMGKNVTQSLFIVTLLQGTIQSKLEKPIDNKTPHTDDVEKREAHMQDCSHSKAMGVCQLLLLMMASPYYCMMITSKG